jgi:ArsR family transcriptional regulator
LILPCAPSPSAAPQPDDAATERIALLAKALGHPARIRIVETLLERSGCMGGDLSQALGLAASTTSEHLRILKEAGVVTGEISGVRVCYALAPAALAPLADLIRRVAERPLASLERDCVGDCAP